jgi:hypothetical protein
MGGAAFFGLALISGSKLVATLAVISVLSHFWFLSMVEKYVSDDHYYAETPLISTLTWQSTYASSIW